MSIQVRTYDGDDRELAGFISRSWRSYYTEKSWMPEEDAKCLAWKFLVRRDESRNFRLAAYEGSRLVGCFLAESFPFWVNGRQIEGTIGSWFTVDPEFVRTPAPFKLVNEMERRHLERGKAFLLGYVLTDHRTVAARFWSAYARMFPQRLRMIGQCGIWIRVLNPRGIAAKVGDAAWRTALRCLGIVQRCAPKWECNGVVRDYRASDLDACVKLCEEELRGAALSHRWRRDRLDVQLGYPAIPRTLVLDYNGAIEGILNYHCTSFRSRGLVRTALIDLFVGRRLSLRDRVGMLSEATRRMLAEGMDGVIAPRFDFDNLQTMVACGYAPSQKLLQVVSLCCNNERIDVNNGRVQLLLR